MAKSEEVKAFGHIELKPRIVVREGKDLLQLLFDNFSLYHMALNRDLPLIYLAKKGLDVGIRKS